MAYGDGKLFKNPRSSVWHMRFFVNGRKRVESTGEVDEGKARNKLRLRIAEVLSGAVAPTTGKGLTLADLLGLVRVDYELKRLRSLPTLGYLARHLSEHFGDTTHIKAITSDRVDAYIVARRGEGAADSSIRSEVHVLDRGFKLAVEKRALPPGLRPLIRNVNVGNRNAREGFITRDQLDAVCEALTTLPLDRRWCRTRDDAEGVADFVAFLFHSAWRIGEVRSLLWSDFDREAWGFTLRREADKTGQGRVLPVEGELRPIVERRLAARRLGLAHVFHMAGQPVGDIGKRWDRACEAAGIGRRVPHDLRRSGVRHMRLAGIDQQTIMKMTGHRTASMFARYSIVDVADVRAAQLKTARVAPVAPAEVIELRPKSKG